MPAERADTAARDHEIGSVYWPLMIGFLAVTIVATCALDPWENISRAVLAIVLSVGLGIGYLGIGRLFQRVLDLEERMEELTYEQGYEHGDVGRLFERVLHLENQRDALTRAKEE